MLSRKVMIENLKRLGLKDAISDENAMVDGTPAILLRWNGKEEYYTGLDICTEKPVEQSEADYQAFLTENFS